MGWGSVAAHPAEAAQEAEPAAAVVVAMAMAARAEEAAGWEVLGCQAVQVVVVGGAVQVVGGVAMVGWAGRVAVWVLAGPRDVEMAGTAVSMPPHWRSRSAGQQRPPHLAAALLCWRFAPAQC